MPKRPPSELRHFRLRAVWTGIRTPAWVVQERMFPGLWKTLFVSGSDITCALWLDAEVERRQEKTAHLQRPDVRVERHY